MNTGCSGCSGTKVNVMGPPYQIVTVLGTKYAKTTICTSCDGTGQARCALCRGDGVYCAPDHYGTLRYYECSCACRDPAQYDEETPD